MPGHDYKMFRKPERRKLSVPKPKVKMWNHQDELQEMKGKRVHVYIGEIKLECVLLNADQFTIQIEQDDKSVLTMFKHSIDGYSIAYAE